MVISFFFQAEDGIRDLYVTGVQTCALPISFVVHATQAAAGDVDHDEGAVVALEIDGPVEARGLPRPLACDGENVGLGIPVIADLGKLAVERLDSGFEVRRQPRLPGSAGGA